MFKKLFWVTDFSAVAQDSGWRSRFCVQCGGGTKEGRYSRKKRECYKNDLDLWKIYHDHQ